MGILSRLFRMMITKVSLCVMAVGAFTSGGQPSRSSYIIKHIYGIVFNRLGAVNMRASVWRQTFAIPFLNISTPYYPQGQWTSGRTHSFCTWVIEASSRFTQHHREILSKVISDMEIIQVGKVSVFLTTRPNPCGSHCLPLMCRLN